MHPFAFFVQTADVGPTTASGGRAGCTLRFCVPWPGRQIDSEGQGMKLTALSMPKNDHDTHKMILHLRELIPYLSEEASDDSLRLCVMAFDAYEATLADKQADWPVELPLSFLQVGAMLNEDPALVGYTAREKEDEMHLRLRMLRDRMRVERTKRDLLWKYVEAFPKEDAVLFKHAEDFSDAAHKGQFRDSGEPYIVHPLEVAEIILDMGMDTDAIITGLLHDTVEDNEDITAEMIAEQFSENIAALVEGVTKLTKASLTGKQSKEHQQAENVRKMFLAMAKDIRVIPIKLCDRLHNMRTLEYCHSEKRVRKAQETLEIYAPLAHRLGMGQVKSELEDLSFMHIDPTGYQALKTKVEELREQRSGFLNKAMEQIRKMMEEAGIQGELHGRPKHIYSIHRKMQRQGCSFEQVHDLIAIRVIVGNVRDCYEVLGQVHSVWRPLPGRIKDYISTPKPNGYRSLHTTLVGDSGMPFEVQVRTEEMHKMAEYGIAAHWKYKEGRAASSDLDFVLDWVRQLMDEKIEDSDEFMRVLKFDFFSDYVFVFTPEGDIIDLVTGSTPIDFAYRIHSDVGNHCNGAEINGRIVPLDYQLQMGDIVKINTAANQRGPKRDWLNIVKTQQAKSKIRAWFKRELKEDNIQQGHDMLASEAKKQGYVLSQILQPDKVPDMFRKLSISSIDDLYAAVGYGSLHTNQVVPRLIEESKEEDKAAEQARILEAIAIKRAHRVAQKQSADESIIVKGESGMLTRIAQCCAPVPGDQIVGYITRGRGVSVHRADCKNLENMPEGSVRFVDVKWSGAKHKEGRFTAHVQVEGMERSGLMFDITQVFLSMNLSLSGINARLDRSDMVSYVTLAFDVRDGEHLESVVKQLMRIEGVFNVTRVQT